MARRLAPSGLGEDADVRGPVDRPPSIVVSVVGGGASVDSVGPDADLVALPVVGMRARTAWELAPGRGQGVAVVEPVLDVELSGLLARAVVGAPRAGRPRSRIAAVHDMDEGGGRLTRAGCPHDADLGALAARSAAAGAKVDW
jgi:hypothetical protein